MQNALRAVILIGLLMLAGSAFKCSEKQQKDFRAGVHIAASSTREFRATVDDYCSQGLINPESCEKNKPTLDKITDIAARADQFANDHASLDVSSKKQLLTLLDDALSAADELEKDGVIEFKDENKRRDFLLVVNASKAVIRGFRVSVDSANVQ